ncbi:hypothetical protein HanIR_Chr07g0329711 [Helianthus annuus]|nr:hypothetical protein HanIR_Chr07g0329711 [Helianthus annuus]
MKHGLMPSIIKYPSWGRFRDGNAIGTFPKRFQKSGDDRMTFRGRFLLYPAKKIRLQTMMKMIIEEEDKDSG